MCWFIGVFVLLELALVSLHAGSLAGVVIDPQKEPLVGIAVVAWSARQEADGNRAKLAVATTDTGGRFRLEAENAKFELLTLEGTAGTGRVRVDPGSDAELSIAYPVRTTIVFLHDNDLHFNFNQADRFEAEVTRIRSENHNVFLFNSGDMFIRHRYCWNEPVDAFYIEHSHAIIDRLNALGYVVATLGNHELDYIGGLTKAALERAKFPLLAANIDITTDQLPIPKPFITLTTDNDIDIAVVGLSVCVKKEGVAMRSPTKTFAALRPQIDKATICLALTHIGFPNDIKLALTAPDIDVIIGAHSHTLLREAIITNGVLIAQAGGTASRRKNSVDPRRPKFLGIVTLTLDNDRIVEKSGRVISFVSEP